MGTSREARVLRGSKVGYGIGLLFTVMPVLMGIGFTTQWAQRGVMVNDQLRKDPGVLVLSLVLLSLFATIGIAFLVASHHIRVEIDRSGITICGFRGRPTFSAKWSEITAYHRRNKARVRVHVAGMNRGDWVIAAGDNWQNVPSVDDMKALHSLVVSRLPDGVLKSEDVPAIDLNRISESLESDLRRSRSLYSMAFSIAWYGFLAFFLYAALFLQKWPTNSSDAFGMATMISVCILFAVIPFTTFRDAWLKYRFGKVTADQSEIAYKDGRTETRIPWQDVRMVERSVIDVGENGTMRRLTIVSDSAGIQIDDDVNDFEGLASFAFAHAPPTACLFP